MIIEQAYQLLKRKHTALIDDLFIADVCVGAYLTAIRLSDGSSGVVSTGMERSPAAQKKDRFFGPFSPGRIIGRKAVDLFNEDYPLSILPTLRLAVLNAISSSLMTFGHYKIIDDCDPIDLIDLQGSQTITMVGAFQSYIRQISATRNKLFVLELNEKTFYEEQVEYYRPAEEYKTILPISDIIIITGMALINGTMADILEAIPKGRKVIVVGPSGSFIPELLFSKGVSIIGATRITNPELLFEMVSQAASGFYLFGHCAQKICILPKD
jgi:uncharacterized protein (DUF4213/DUF364 family)